MSKLSLDQIGAALPESAWKVVEVTDTHITSEATVDIGTIRRRQLIGDDELLEWNKHCFETSGRFSQREAGAIGTPVANVPLSMIYSPQTNIAKKLREGDRDHLRWWLNSENARPFRTHKGKL